MSARPVQAASATSLTLGGRELLSFAGTSYLGLAHHPEVLAAAREALERCGLSAAAARGTSGNFAEHEELEARLACFLQVEAALLLPDGWLADVAALEAHAQEIELVLVDAEAHDSLWAGAAATGARTLDFGYGNMARLRDLLEEHSEERVAFLADGLYPMQQRLAEVTELLQLLPPWGLCVLDDSHGLGVLGEHGRGSASEARAEDPRLLLTGSLAKALGAGGGFVAGSDRRVALVRERSEVFAGTTPLPPAVCAAARAALGVLEREPERHARLRANAELLARLARDLDLPPSDPRVPVLAVPVAEEARGRALEEALAAAGLFVPWTRYGGAAGALRVSVNSEHSAADLDRLRSRLVAELARP